MRRSLFILFSVIVFFTESVSAQMPFTVKDGVTYVDKGLPVTPLWFADSRLAFSFDEAGVSQLDYYSPEPHQNLPTLFLRQLWDGFRYFITAEGKTYKPEFGNSRIWPFGIESQWKMGSVIFRQKIMAVEENLLIQITTPENLPDGFHFKLEFFEAFGLTRGSDDDLRYKNGAFTRKWNPWKFDSVGNRLTGSFTSTPLPDAEKKGIRPFDVYCTIGADFPISHLLRPINPKHILQGPELKKNKTYSFLVSFGNRKEPVEKRNREQLYSCSQLLSRQYDRYKMVAAKSPVLESPYTDLNNFISLAPMYHESLKIKDTPGAVRAKTTNYFVWGWDGMTSNESTAFWGDTAHIRQMLALYETSADSAGGIGHAFDYNMKPSSISALPAQGMYISLLQLYYQHTGDLQTVKDRYAFATTIFNRMSDKEVQGTGMSEGTSLFPDFPDLMYETGKDISGFNNTVYYSAVRSMEWLAGLLKDKGEQRKAAAIAGRIEKHFVPLFFDKTKGFVASSVDAVTLQKRNSYVLSSIRWENEYCGDLTYDIDSASLSFLTRNNVTPMGLREIPVWANSFDMDANQLHCWWPATGEYFMRLSNAFDKPDLINEWIRWVGYWTRSLSCPEGISNYIETDEPEFDRWTSQKGAWQAYSTRAWYEAAIHNVVGVDTDPGGITFYPYSGQEMQLKGMHYLGRQFDIQMKGAGRYIDSIVVDGRKLLGSHKLPVELYLKSRRPSVMVYRSKVRTTPVIIRSANAVQIEKYQFNGKSIRAVISGYGAGRIRLEADHRPVVKMNGRRLNFVYSANRQEAMVELSLENGVKSMIEID